MEFKDKLKALRNERGLLQKDIAKLLYLRNTAISSWETGKSEPPIDTIKKLANFFNISVDELIGSDEERNTNYDFEYKGQNTFLKHIETHQSISSASKKHTIELTDEEYKSFIKIFEKLKK